MMRILTGAALLATVSGPSAADHSDVMAFLSGGALSMSLEQFDDCVFEGAEPRPFADMTGPCQAALQPCHARMHLQDNEIPHDIGRRVLLERCLREDGGRFHILLQRHLVEVFGALPDDLDEDARADVITAMVDTPQEVTRAAYETCLEDVTDTGRVEIGAQRCERAWRYDQLIRSRQAVKEATP